MKSMNEKTTHKKATALSILSANCLNLKSPLADCQICQTVCPQNALSFHDEKWEAVNCTLCGICAMVCPTQVFQIDLPYLLALPSQDLILTCTQNSAVPKNALHINCMQQLTPLSVIHLLYRHTSVSIYLPAEQCEQCTHHWYAQGFIQQLNSYQIPSDKLKIITTAHQPPAAENGRRELFRDLLHRTEDSTKKAITHTVEKITAEFSSKELEQKEPAVFPNRLPLYALYLKQQLPIPDAQELPFRHLQCTACTFCGACMHICPTQALEMKNEQEEKQLLFHPELCINCNLCNTICMQRGLTWEDFMTTKQFIQSPIILAHSQEQICSQCEHEFYQWPSTPDSTEPVCSFCR